VVPLGSEVLLNSSDGDDLSSNALLKFPSGSTTVFCPINIHNRHWILLVLRCLTNKIEVYDPRGNDHPNAIRKYQIFLGDPTWQASYPKSARRIPRQSPDNGFDWGVFVCLYASYLMNHQTFDFTQSDIPDMRKWLAYRIARG
jgi:Ulp1 family protease